MARNLSSLTISQPSVDPDISVSGTFTFEVTPGFAGGGSVNAYDLNFEYDQGTGSWIDIPASSGGLTTSDTNPIASTTSVDPTSITVTGVTADGYSIRVTNDSRGVTSGTQTVTVSANDRTVTCTTEAITVTGNDATVDQKRDLSCDSESLVLAENQSTIDKARGVAATTENLSIGFNQATVNKPLNLTCTTEALTLVGNTATIDTGVAESVVSVTPSSFTNGTPNIAIVTAGINTDIASVFIGGVRQIITARAVNSLTITSVQGDTPNGSAELLVEESDHYAQGVNNDIMYYVNGDIVEFE